MAATLLQVLDTILPVFLVAGIGYAFARWGLGRLGGGGRRPSAGDVAPGPTRTDATLGVRRALHALTFHVAGPAFVFTALRGSDLSLEAFGMPAAMAAIMYAVLVVVGLAIAGVGRWAPPARKAAVLALASKNCGNYGLPVILFAFGEDGLVIGTVFMITHLLVHMTLGLSIAAWDREHRVLRRLTNLLRFPYVYAIGLALLLRGLGVSVPAAIERPLALVGQMWIPLMLILLGVELSNIRVAHVWRPAVWLTSVKLIVPPLAAFGLTALLGIDGSVRAILVLQASTPTAVNGLLVARQFDARPDLVATTLLLTTVGSLVTMSVLLGLLA